MDIATFIRSEHGRSISQNKLYRRLRRFVEKKTAHQSAPVLRDLAEGEDEKWFLGSRLTASETSVVTGERRRLLDALGEIVEKCMPEG